MCGARCTLLRRQEVQRQGLRKKANAKGKVEPGGTQRRAFSPRDKQCGDSGYNEGGTTLNAGIAQYIKKGNLKRTEGNMKHVLGH